MAEKLLTDDYVVGIANRVVNKLRGRWPGGLSRADAVGDATVLILSLAPFYDDRMRATGRPRAEWPPFEAWLVKRTWGDLVDRYARQWRKDAGAPTCQLYDQDGPETPIARELASEDPASASVVSLDVQDAIDQLTESEAYAIRCQMYGMTQVEIGEAIGYTQPYVSSLLKSARVKLAELLKDYAAEEDE